MKFIQTQKKWLIMAERDNSGRFVKGHAPLKKVGHKAILSRNVKISLEALVGQEVGKLPQYFAQIKSPEKKIEALTRLLPFILPKAEIDKKETLIAHSFTISLLDDHDVKPYQIHLTHGKDE